MSELLTETTEHWEHILSDWESSGLTQAVFCRQHGLSLNRFCYQRSKLAKKNKSIHFNKIHLSDEVSEAISSFKFILLDQTQIIVPANRHALIEILSALRMLSC